ncbi:MAG: acyl carrier protein [Geminicoccaceae bacterium]
MQATIRSYIIDDLLSGKPVADDDNLLLSGLIDSLGVMRLVRFLESSFAIKIPAEDVTIDHFESIRTITAYVETRRQAA